MGSCNYSHKLSGRTADEVPGISERARRRGGKGKRVYGGEKRGVRGRERSERGALSGWLFFPHFSSLFSPLWVCIMWRCIIGLWSHQSCTNRLAGKHVSLRGCRGECVCCVNYRCGIVWEVVWWSKTFINDEQVGQLPLSQTNLFFEGTFREYRCIHP